MSLYIVPVTVVICVKLVQPAFWQRSTRYPVTPTLSVDAVQARLIWLADAAVAVRLDGAEGGVVSGGAGVTALATFELELWLLAASVGRTRWISLVLPVSAVSLY